jgi:methionine-rich copper-binding protein CopC
MNGAPALQCLTRAAWGCWACCALSGCLDSPLSENMLREAGVAAEPAPGALQLALRAGETPDLKVLAVRVVDGATGTTAEIHTVDLTREALDFEVELPPGDYVVRFRGVTAQSQVCVGSGSFEIQPHARAVVDVQVLCDPQPLAIGKAKLSVALPNGDVIGSTIVDIDQNQIATSSFVQMPPGNYVVWVTASTVDGQPCAGSLDLVVRGGVSTAVDVEVLCER